MKLLERLSQLKSLGEESGQAILEYLLMAVISFVIISGLLYQFNEGMRDYIDSFFSGYLVCLLETGELPALGSQSGGSVCQGGQFDISSSVPGAGDGVSGGSGGSGGEGGDSASAGSDDSGSASRRRRRSRGSARNADGRGGGGSNGGINGSSRPSVQRAPSSTSGSGGSSQESSSYTGSSASSSGGGRGRSAGRNAKGGRVAAFGFAYIDEDAKKNEKDREPASKKVKDGKKSVERAGRKEKIEFTPPPPKSKAQQEAEVGGFEMSKYLKWIIIAGLIVAIVVFVGGQALNITKGWNTK